MPDDPPTTKRPQPLRWVRTVDDQLFVVVARTQQDTAEELRRRQVRSAIVLAIGATGLAASLRMDHASPWFPIAALTVALVWAGGAWWSGRLHLGRILVDGRLERPIAQPILLGIALAAVFVAGAYVTLRIPALAAQVRDVLGFAQSGSLTLLTVTTLLSGIAEELFFRGGLYAAIPRPHQLWTSTVLYIAATVLTGNVMLAFAAAVLGLVTGLQRRATGGVLAPILTHITWSLSMLYVLPHVL
jgi:membrane protease YdiL (CAAX protease family)